MIETIKKMFALQLVNWYWLIFKERSLHGVVAIVLDCNIIVNNFEF